MLIAMANGKGGCSKSTTSVHLAHWLARRGHSVQLVDLDPQLTSSFWLQASETIAVPFTQMAPDAGVVLDQLPALAADSDYLIVDGPAGLADAVRATLLLADLAVIPVQPSGADVRAAIDAVRLVNQARMVRGGAPEARIFISRATRGTRLLSEARDVLGQFDGIPLLKTAITQRQVIADAFGQAVSVLDATTGPGLEAGHEYERLFQELLPDA